MNAPANKKISKVAPVAPSLPAKQWFSTVLTIIIITFFLITLAFIVSFGWQEINRIQALETRLSDYFDSQSQLRGNQLIANTQLTDSRMARLEAHIGTLQQGVNDLTLRVDRIEQASGFRQATINQELEHIQIRLEEIRPQETEQRQLLQRTDLQRLQSGLDLATNPIFLAGDGLAALSQLEIVADITRKSTLEPRQINAVLTAVNKDIESLTTHRKRLFVQPLSNLKTMEQQFKQYIDLNYKKLEKLEPQEVSFSNDWWTITRTFLERVIIFRVYEPLSVNLEGYADLAAFSHDVQSAITLAKNALYSSNNIAWNVAILQLNTLAQNVPSVDENPSLAALNDLDKLAPLPVPMHTINVLLQIKVTSEELVEN